MSSSIPIKKKPRKHILSTPTEIVWMILDYLPPESVLSFALTCKTLYHEYPKKEPGLVILIIPRARYESHPNVVRVWRDWAASSCSAITAATRFTYRTIVNTTPDSDRNFQHDDDTTSILTAGLKSLGTR
ncbi:hypothetical protein QBC38DRAFT_451055 [Podospora fimiseda]|uniref:F-box domain-containing protein n=1 Tax=Podospora fimiseda TaxID=252190 RepID=A0AAN7BYI0_9PEZI|nr:hypothetical protein QBC38DRAFT_451055 [Podospora fimiseda]